MPTITRSETNVASNAYSMRSWPFEDNSARHTAATADAHRFGSTSCLLVRDYHAGRAGERDRSHCQDAPRQVERLRNLHADGIARLVVGRGGATQLRRAVP